MGDMTAPSTIADALAWHRIFLEKRIFASPISPGRLCTGALLFKSRRPPKPATPSRYSLAQL
jgi:hypothetical protein